MATCSCYQGEREGGGGGVLRVLLITVLRQSSREVYKAIVIFRGRCLVIAGEGCIALFAGLMDLAGIAGLPDPDVVARKEREQSLRRLVRPTDLSRLVN